MTGTREAETGAHAPGNDDLIPILEAIEFSGRSRRTLENWINAGLLDKYVQGANRTYVSRGQLNGLLVPRRVSQEGEPVVPSED